MTDIQTTLESATKLLTEISDSAALDADVLLCYTLGKSRSFLRAWPKKQLLIEQQQKFNQLLKQRQSGVPIAYITECREFWSREFYVTPDVLIPRPDTELLIELSLNLIADKLNPHLIDLGTGSGNIAITMAAERPDIQVCATDFSNEALKIAKLNAETHKADNINFIQSSWFEEITYSEFDLVISNPPYIAQNDPHLLKGDVRFEPETALIAENQGLRNIKRICNQARRFLKSEGSLLIEHGCDQQSVVQALFKRFDFQSIKTYDDLSGNPRVTTGQWSPK